MQIVSTKVHRDFKILEGSLEVLNVKYEKWFSIKANTRYRGQRIEIRKANFWGTKFSILKNDQEAGLIRFNWKGQATIRLDELVDESQEYLLKSKSTWKPHFEVYQETGELLFSMHSIAKWYSTKMAYAIEKTQAELPLDEFEFLIYCGFAVNKLLANRASAG